MPTVRPPTLISTPLGMVMGSLPIRLIASSPYVREDLATEALALRFAAGHEAGRGRHDGHAEPSEHARHLVLARVHAQPGLRDAPQARHRREFPDVLQAEHDLPRVRLLVA